MKSFTVVFFFFEGVVNATCHTLCLQSQPLFAFPIPSGGPGFRMLLLPFFFFFLIPLTIGHFRNEIAFPAYLCSPNGSAGHFSCLCFFFGFLYRSALPLARVMSNLLFDTLVFIECRTLDYCYS